MALRPVHKVWEDDFRGHGEIECYFWSLGSEVGEIKYQGAIGARVDDLDNVGGLVLERSFQSPGKRQGWARLERC